ncbi:MAG: HD domain-containing protein, partial [Haliea sp.]
MNVDRFLDPLYGRIEVSSAEQALLFAPEVQRLRYVRMCNINSLLISGASEISRFEHTVGVLHLAKVWAEANSLPSRDGQIVCSAAILHDMMTGPFGHSMEYVLSEQSVDGGFVHEDLSFGQGQRYFQATHANTRFAGAPFSADTILGSNWAEVTDTIAGRGRYGPILAGSIDLDNIDNVVRLAFHVGIADRHDAHGAVALAERLRLVDGCLEVDAYGEELIVAWQAIRTNLYRLLLEDSAEFSAKAMLTRMIESSVASGLIGADSWLLTDDELLARLKDESIGESQGVGELARRLVLGDLYYPVLLAQLPGVKPYDSVANTVFKEYLEQEISRELQCRIIIHFIKDYGKTQRSITLGSNSLGTRR